MTKQADYRDKLRFFFHWHIKICITTRFYDHISGRQQVGFQDGFAIFQELLVNRFIEDFTVFQLIDADYHRLGESVIFAGIGV